MLVGSLNWNEQAAAENREVLSRLDGQGPGRYFTSVFETDWQGGTRDLPLGPIAAVVGVLVVGGLAARRLEFDLDGVR